MSLRARLARLRARRGLMDIGALSASSYLANALNLVRSLIAARVLEADAFSAWRLVLIFLRYTPSADLGAAAGVMPRVSLALGREDAHDAELHAGTALGWAMLASAAIAFGLLGFGAWRWLVGDALGATTLFVVAALALPAQVHFFAQNLFLAHQRIQSLAVIELLFAAVFTLLAVPLLLGLGLVGIGLAALVGQLFFVALALYRSPTPLRPDLSLTRFRSLRAAGLPIALRGITMTALVTADQLVIARVLGLERMADYAFAWTLVGALSVAPAAVGRAIAPRALRSYGSREREADLLAIAAPATQGLAWLMAAIAALALFFGRPAVEWIFPEYAGAVPIFAVLLVGWYAWSLQYGAAGAAVAFQRVPAHMAIQLALALVLAGGVWWLASRGASLVAIAALTSSVLVAHYLAFGYWIVYRSSRVWLVSTLHGAVPMVLAIGGAFALEAVPLPFERSVASIVRGVLFACGFAPLVWSQVRHLRRAEVEGER